MANRVLRDWTANKRINKLTPEAEVLFSRLIMKMDDGGNFHREAELVKSLAFPRKAGIRIADIDRWLIELEATDLIRCYSAKGDAFLHIVNHGQRKDRTHLVFPKEPDGFDIREDEIPSAAVCGEPPPETKRNEIETKRNETAKIDIEFEFLNSQAWIEQTAMALKIPLSELKIKMEKFIQEKKLTTGLKTLEDARSHFFNLIKLKASKQAVEFKPKYKKFNNGN